MGLLSFLSFRKTSDESQEIPAGNIKARAYNATAPSLTPFKGTYPVAGNGPTSALETIQKSDLKSSQRSFVLNDAHEVSAPAPFVPRFRELSVERPQTAPHHAQVGDMRRKLHRTRSRRGTMTPPPVSFRKTRRRTGSVASTTHSVPNPVRQVSSIPHLRPRSPAVSVVNTYEASTRSMASGRNFIDILDAQSEIRQLGFHSRLRAAGARDYGEDVADRNVGENGVDLSSPQVRAFYASVNRQRPSAASAPLDCGKTSTDATTARKSHMPVLHPLTQNPATPAEQEFLASRDARTNCRLSGTGAVGLGRRKSLGSYGSYTTSLSRILTKQSARPRTMYGLRQDEFGVSEAKPLSGTTPSLGSLRTNAEANADADPGFDLRHHPAPNFSPQLSSPLPSFARDSVLLARTNYSLPPGLRTPGRSPPARLSAMSLAHKNSSAASDAHLTSRGLRAPYSDSRASSRRLSRPKSIRLDMPSDTLLAVSTIGHRLDTGRVTSASYTTRDGHLRNYGQEEPSEKSKRNTLGEPYEETEVPIRSSSLRQWSVSSSNTPTASSVGSPFRRPQSHHTADTSVDMTPVLSDKTIQSRQAQNSSVSRTEDDASSYTTILERNIHELNVTPQMSFSWWNTPDVTPDVNITEDHFPLDNPIVFNVDEGLDSDRDADSDSVTGGGRAPGECEGHLLFRDTGYGIGGLQLPGLFDSISAVPVETQDQDDEEPDMPQIRPASTPPPVLRRARRSAVVDMWGRVDGGPSWMGTNTCNDTEDEDDEGNGEYSSDEHSEDNAIFSDSDDSAYGPSVPADIPTVRKGSVRLFSAIWSDRDAISTTSQGEGDKADVRSVVQLRKETKARLRAGGVLTPRSDRSGNRREPSRGRTLDRGI